MIIQISLSEVVDESNGDTRSVRREVHVLSDVVDLNLLVSSSTDR